MLEGKRLYLRASIGVATTASGPELLRNADLAMYAAKAAGTNRCAVFTDDMHVNAVERLDRREQLERAIENDELRLHYQPIVDLDLGRVAGFEALVRWQHPTRGFLGPGEFIPLGRGDRADRAAGALGPARGGAPGRAVGGRALSVGERRLRPARAAGLRRRGGAPRCPTAAWTPARLMLEVTESSLVGDLEAERLQALRRLGVRLAIDDFGTGYSSLSYLRRFPMDVLKIDRSFTRDACDDSALLQAIVAMGESLGLVLIPEGIEEPEQADALRALGCRLGQGFLSAAPSRPRNSSAWRSAPPPDSTLNVSVRGFFVSRRRTVDSRKAAWPA